jgi:hypothetical protein
MNPNTGLAILAAALVLVTAYYAWTVRRLLGTMQDMVAATREMVETASRTYTLSLAPQVECRTVNCESPQDQAADAPKGQRVSETTITNIGPHRVRLSRVRLETDSEGEQVRRFLARWLGPNEREIVRIPFGRATRTKVFVHLEDMAGQDHVVISDDARGPASDEAAG